MTTAPTDANPTLAPLLPGYDDSGHQKNIALRVKNVATDATTGVIYGDLGVDVTVSLPADQTINIDKVAGAAPNFAQETGGNLATLVTNTASGATRQPIAGATGGSTPYHLISANTTNATSVKGTAGTLYGLSISNANAAARYFKLYNKASAPTVGTDVPVRTIQVPANGTVITAFPVGMAFSTGIAFSTNTGIADADTGAVGASDLSIDLDYK